jgi:arabinose-5-phosphate isomerase
MRRERNSVLSITSTEAVEKIDITSETEPLNVERLATAATRKSVNGNNGLKMASPEASMTEAVESFFDLVLGELTNLRSGIEAETIGEAARLILEAESQGGRVHVTGIGKSEHVARYFASLLSSTGTPAYFLHATECAHGSAGQVRENDVTIAISNSGSTPELMFAVDVLRGFGIKIIAISSEPKSPLAQVADVLIRIGIENEGGELNLVPRVSVLAKIYVLCALSVALESHKGLTREQYARWHPGGNLGRIARGE